VRLKYRQIFERSRACLLTVAEPRSRIDGQVYTTIRRWPGDLIRLFKSPHRATVLPARLGGQVGHLRSCECAIPRASASVLSRAPSKKGEG
jgi:hypothetical protein